MIIVKVEVKAVMFASLENGGHMQIKEVVEYPGIVITSFKETRNHEWVNTIIYGDTEYKTIKDAVEAHKADGKA